MSTFAQYAWYYDSLYHKKDYAAESAYVKSLIERHSPGNCHLLELGCGTGIHARYLAESGYSVQGIDSSGTMLAIAETKKRQLPDQIRARLSFAEGDVRSIRMPQKYGCVISLFHVVSYLTTNDDLQRMFETANAHLVDGGLLIFDCWYGPAVLNLRPSTRVKNIETDAVTAVRIAEPTLLANENVVVVNYTLLISDKATHKLEVVKEQHRMRYLFRPEIEMFAKNANLEICGAHAWMTDQEPGLESWSACFMGRK